MKRLDKLLLVNWHYIVHDLLNVEAVTFITGKNGAGKSTILDALQMLILGDTSGHFFNKAANDNSRRTLRGYLYGEIGEREETGLIYLRANRTFSSYVVAQFTDTVKKKKLCMGVVFDCEPDGQYNYRFFSLFDELPTFRFIRDDTPLGIQGLRQWGARLGKGKFELYETNKRYQDMFRSHMGNIGEKFFRLFRKAVPFSPIMDVAGFISEFVCDVEHRLDIADMRDNIRHYRRMEAELGYVQRKVAALTKVGQQAESLAAVEERLRMYRYLLDRAQVAELETTLQEIDRDLEHGQSRLAALAESMAQDETRLLEVQAQRDQWREERARSDVYMVQQRLDNRRELLETEFVGIRQTIQRQERLLLELSARWSAACAALQQTPSWFVAARPAGEALATDPLPTMPMLVEDLLATAPRVIDQALALLRPSCAVEGLELLHADPARYTIDSSNLERAQELFVDTAERLREAQRILKTTLADWEQEARDLETAIAELKRGIKPYDPKVVTLQQAIAAGLAEPTVGPAPVTIFAEMLDIPDPTWHRAIEGYLHTQRFYLLVAPENFQAALRIYDAVKRDKRIYDVGLIDIGRVLEQHPERLPGSLAEEVVTADPFARAYADFLLGRVMKCERIEQLRQHRTAITQDGMLYQNFVARQLDPKRWESLFIGKRALAQQLEQKGARLHTVEMAVAAWTPRARSATQWVQLAPPSDGDLRDVAEAQDVVAKIPSMQEELRKTIDELGGLDLSYLFELEDRIKDCENDLSKINQRLRDATKEQANAEEQLRSLRDTRRPQVTREWEEAKHTVEAGYDAPFAHEQGEPRFIQEQERLGSASAIRANFGRQLQTDANRKEGLWTDLVRLRADYNRDFQAGFDIQRPDNVAYAAELGRLVDSQLNEYEDRIKQAKDRAQIQFQEDFVSKLRSNIETVKGQIRDLNLALRGVTFGRDQYRFDVSANPQYARFYEMLLDELLMEGYGLFSQSFQEKHGIVVEELFRNIVDVDESDPLAMTELEKNLEKFTDYRTYLNFDLIVKDEEGRESRLSRVIAKKSGGETQTPFYISVLASFVQLYRIGRPGADNTLRLIVFDEAYSKMDHQRIRESVKLIRDLGLQVILSAPTEKLADIAPLVDRTLIVTRIQSQTKILEFDMAKEAVNARR